MLRSVVLGCGSYLPRRVLPNSELSRMVDTSDEWITQRTGIRERHIAAEGENTSDLAIAAAREALDAAGVDAQSIDLIVLATSWSNTRKPSPPRWTAPSSFSSAPLPAWRVVASMSS